LHKKEFRLRGDDLTGECCAPWCALGEDVSLKIPQISWRGVSQASTELREDRLLDHRCLGRARRLRHRPEPNRRQLRAARADKIRLLMSTESQVVLNIEKFSNPPAATMLEWGLKA